jgi:hypothetical protein
MRKITLLIIWLVASHSFSFAQTATVKGVIFDNFNEMNLAGANVSLLKNDSTVYKSTRSDLNGVFEFKNLLPGNYLLSIKHSLYEDRINKLKLDSNSKINTGVIKMSYKSINLKGVTVLQQISRIKINGDTTEYNPLGFKTRPGASVEDMLKKLPGIKVDKDGTIKAMGTTVEKVYVDGEEFFGNDPTIATKNLQADAIAKIQVFDKKSDQATFSGIDDGSRSRTINIQLKKNMNKGNFGKVDLGIGLDDKYNNTLMINHFNDKTKVSLYGSLSSIDVDGVDLSPGKRRNSNNLSEVNANIAGLASSANTDNEINSVLSSGEGLPKSVSGGINYSDKFNRSQQSINGSYQYNQVSSTGYENTFSQSILPDTVFVDSEATKSNSNNQRHSMNGTYEWQINKSTSMKLYVNASEGKATGNSNFTGEARDNLMNLVNSSKRDVDASGDDKSLESTFLIRKRFNKAGRTISLNVGQSYSDNKSNGFLYSLNAFYGKKGRVSFSDTTDQKKINTSLSTSLNGSLVYTEPLSKAFFMELRYAFSGSHNNAQRSSFEKDLKGNYNVLNDTLSNHYNFDVFTNVAGLAFKYNSKKVTLSVGSLVARSRYKQSNFAGDAAIARDFSNLYPKATFSVKFNDNSNLSLVYSGNSRQPSINQIQPIPDNYNPLRIVVGNPLLKQEFNHNMNFNFNTYNLNTQQGLFFTGNLSLQSNAIVTNSFTDKLGRTVYKYVNASGNYNYNTGFNYSINIDNFGLDLNTGVNYSKSNYSNIVNDQKNTTNTTATAISFGLNKEDDLLYNFSYDGTIRFNKSLSSIRKDIQTKYWIQEHTLDLTIFLPWKFELNNELEASLQQKVASFNGNNNVILWNGSFGKKFLKNDKATIQIVAHDILNRSRGYSRFISSNVIEESNYQTIARYFLLNFTWNFSKMAAAPKQK